MSEPSVNLTNHFLIAMPNMADPHFTRTLTYICEHNDQGAIGLIVNRPLEMTLGTLFDRIELAIGQHEHDETPIYFGGPVQTDRGFVLHRPVGHWQATLAVNGDIGLTSSRDILQAFGQTGEPSDIIVTLGYAGWGTGQLEWELTQNAWLTVQADPRVMFALPAEERLPAAMHLLGVDFANLSEVAGHG